MVTGTVSTLPEINTARLTMQQALAMVPELIQQAVINAQFAKYPHSASSAMLKIWQAQLKAGNVIEAQAIFIEVKKTASMIGYAYDKAMAFISIVEVQLKAGDVSGAKQTAATIEGTRRKSDALRLIAKAQAEAGDIAEAKGSPINK